MTIVRIKLDNVCENPLKIASSASDGRLLFFCYHYVLNACEEASMLFQIDIQNISKILWPHLRRGRLSLTETNETNHCAEAPFYLLNFFPI